VVDSNGDEVVKQVSADGPREVVTDKQRTGLRPDRNERNSWHRI
jgi:hypothetical protein